MTVLSSLPAVQYLDDTDPYHYTVDNRPLLNLANRDEAIATAFDAAMPLNGYTSFNYGVKDVNFNSAGDTPFNISLPVGLSTYYLNHCFVIGVSGTFTTATLGVYSAPSRGGTILATLTPLSSITTTIANASGKMMLLPLPGGSTNVYDFTTLYINVGTAQGSLSTGHVIFSLRPLF